MNRRIPTITIRRHTHNLRTTITTMNIMTQRNITTSRFRGNIQRIKSFRHTKQSIMVLSNRQGKRLANPSICLKTSFNPRMRILRNSRHLTLLINQTKRTLRLRLMIRHAKSITHRSRARTLSIRQQQVFTIHSPSINLKNMTSLYVTQGFKRHNRGLLRPNSLLQSFFQQDNIINIISLNNTYSKYQSYTKTFQNKLYKKHLHNNKRTRYNNRRRYK